MHWLDRLTATNPGRRDNGSLVFHRGWGTPDDVARYRKEMQEDPGVVGMDVAWGTASIQDGIRTVDGVFTSPVAGVPDFAAEGHTRLVLPDGRVDRFVVLIGAWNDHGYGRRKRLALRLARAGIGSALLENPYFGARRPPGGGHPIGTVVDFVIMGRAAVLEARELLVAARSGAFTDHGVDDTTVLGIGGYSMGGNLAAFTSAVSPFGVATAAIAGAHSPAPVFADGVIAGRVAWEALANGSDPRAQLREYMELMSVLHLPAPSHVAAAVLIAGRGDGYVPPEAVVALHRHWQGSELRWTNEGHASLLLLRLPTMANAIAASFARFESL